MRAPYTLRRTEQQLNIGVLVKGSSSKTIAVTKPSQATGPQFDNIV